MPSADRGASGAGRLPRLLGTTVFLAALVAVPSVDLLGLNAPAARRALAGHPVPDREAVLDGDAADAVEATLRAASRSRRHLAPLMGRARHALFGRVHRTVVAGDDDWLFLENRLRASAHVTPTRLDALVTAFARFSEGLRTRGTHLQLVVVPRKGLVCAQHLGEGRLKRPGFEHVLLSRLRAAGVAVTDLVTPFLAEPPAAIWLREDTHWRPGAMALAAREVARDLGRWHPERPRDTALITLDPEPAPADLRRMAGLLPDDEEKPRSPGDALIPLYVVRKGTHHAVLPRDRRESVGAPLWLVGTSFSGTTAFGALLEHATDHTVRNLARGGEGALAPMRRALRTLATTPYPPEVLVWEIPASFFLREPLPEIRARTIAALPAPGVRAARATPLALWSTEGKRVGTALATLRFSSEPRPGVLAPWGIVSGDAQAPLRFRVGLPEGAPPLDYALVTRGARTTGRLTETPAIVSFPDATPGGRPFLRLDFPNETRPRRITLEVAGRPLGPPVPAVRESAEGGGCLLVVTPPPSVDPARCEALILDAPTAYRPGEDAPSVRAIRARTARGPFPLFTARPEAPLPLALHTVCTLEGLEHHEVHALVLELDTAPHPSTGFRARWLGRSGR